MKRKRVGGKRVVPVGQILPKILYESSDVKKLAEVFGCTRMTIYDALDGKTGSELTLRIRKRAIDMGLRERGVENIRIA